MPRESTLRRSATAGPAGCSAARDANLADGGCHGRDARDYSDFRPSRASNEDRSSRGFCIGTGECRPRTRVPGSPSRARSAHRTRSTGTSDRNTAESCTERWPADGTEPGSTRRRAQATRVREPLCEQRGAQSQAAGSAPRCGPISDCQRRFGPIASRSWDSIDRRHRGCGCACDIARQGFERATARLGGVDSAEQRIHGSSANGAPG